MEGQTEVPIFFNNASKLNPTYRKGTVRVANSAFPPFYDVRETQKQIKRIEESKCNLKQNDSLQNEGEQFVSEANASIGSCRFKCLKI